MGFWRGGLDGGEGLWLWVRLFLEGVVEMTLFFWGGIERWGMYCLGRGMKGSEDEVRIEDGYGDEN